MYIVTKLPDDLKIPVLLLALWAQKCPLSEMILSCISIFQVWEKFQPSHIYLCKQRWHTERAKLEHYA